ncbi:hypothetical protein D3C72_2482070 [compost metagenome]
MIIKRSMRIRMDHDDDKITAGDDRLWTMAKTKRAVPRGHGLAGRQFQNFERRFTGHTLQ